MKIINTVAELRCQLDLLKNNGKTIGFVPTLGALHSGHMSLINKCNRQSDITVCSIFVNPTQFNVKSDLDKYPRTFDADSKMLEENDTDIIFYPSLGEVYPTGLITKVDLDFNGLDKVLEGAFRPGHFEGVVEVVKRLLDIVQPDKLFMGQKDFQQFTIIAHMLRTLKINTELVVCPIIRETSGLAMSSRNERLSVNGRLEAAVISKTLTSVKRRKYTRTVNQLKQYAVKKLNSGPFNLEYFSIIDGNTLEDIDVIDRRGYSVACVAVWFEGVRLIDNTILVSPH